MPCIISFFYSFSSKTYVFQSMLAIAVSYNYKGEGAIFLEIWRL